MHSLAACSDSSPSVETARRYRPVSVYESWGLQAAVQISIGGQGSTGREDKKKAGSTSGLSKDKTVNRHAQRLP